MSLFNILVQLPHERLRNLANEFGLSSSSPSKRTILHELTSRYRDEGFIAVLVNDLPQETLGLLRGLVFYTPETETETIAIPASLCTTWCQNLVLDELLTPLFDLGILFRDANLPPDQVIFPEEIRQTIKSLFLSPYRCLQPQGEYELDGMAVRSPGLEAIFHLLCVLLHYRTIQTQKGSIHRKTVERWSTRVGIDYPKETFFQFAVEFCENQGLLSISKEHYRPSVHVKSWFSQEEKTLRSELWSYYSKHRLFRDRWFQQFLTLFRTAEGWIQIHQKSPVFSIADIVNAWGYPDESALILDALEWLAFLGLIQFNHAEMPTTFHITREGIETLCHCSIPTGESPPADFCMLQPNFDFLVPPGFGYAVLWNLEHLAEFKRRDVFTEYHISQHSILFGMRRGWKREEVHDFFRNLTGGRFSGNVEYSLDEWTRRYGQITLRRIVLLECVTPDLAEEIAHVPEVRDMLEQRISDRCYAVSEVHVRTVLRILRERGYEPSAAKRLIDEE